LAARLVEVASSPEHELVRLGRSCRELVEREFNRERYTRAILDVYRDLGVVGPAASPRLSSAERPSSH
jgi:glycosyltransferase involved in cell wall biosynthesis